MRPEGRRATHASDPPPHTSHPRGTNAARLQSRQSCPRHPVHPLSTIISAAAPVEGGRLGNQWAAAVPPPSDRGAPTTPTGAGAVRARPSGQPPPLSRAPRVAVRSRATAKGANAAALPLRNLACMRGKIGPRRNPDPPERAIREDSRHPLGSPAAALLRRARPPPSDVGRAPDEVGSTCSQVKSSRVKSSQVKLAISPLQNTSRRPFIRSVV